MKYAFLGPESTGKTTTAIEVSNQIKGIYVPEYAREYLALKGLNYTYEDILEIAKKQYSLEIITSDKYPTEPILCDTELITIEIWLEYYQYEVPTWIQEAIYTSQYQIYFLFNIDIPWQEDSLRANPHDRENILQQFVRKLNFYQKPWRLISGQHEERIQQVLQLINM